MSDQAHPSRLDRISTSWDLLTQAHQGTGDTASAAQRLLLERYSGAVRRYLGAILRDDAAADDLTQEFGLALLEGKLGGAKPGQGRFRDYVKGAVLHLVSRHRQQQKRRSRPVPDKTPTPAGPVADEDRAFLQGWRDELLARTWEALAQAQSTFFTVLHFRAAHQDLSIQVMIAELSAQLGKALTEEGLRQTLRRARVLFADLLLAEVSRSLREPTQEEVERELGELNLLAYCRPALERKEKGAKGRKRD